MQRFATWLFVALTVLSATPSASVLAQSKRSHGQEPNRVDPGKANKGREPASAPHKSEKRDLGGGRAPHKSRR